MYLNKMSSVLTNLSVIQKLAKQLIRARQLNYSQQCIPYYVNESKFIIEHIDEIKNPSEFILKCTLIKHKNQHMLSSQKQLRNCQTQQKISTYNSNRKCIIYMHGLGSSRLEAFPFVQCLPKQYCLFVFDFAGCGKSEGEDITYGLREAEDVNSIIDYLRVNKGIKEFVLWGRSMGAVAALLYAIELAESSKQSITAKAQLKRIKGLVLDSPFSDFRQITKQIGLKKIKIPQFLLDFVLNFIESSFNQLLKDTKRHDKVYNPFQIKLGQQSIDTKIPTIFLYSMIDEVVPKEHSQKIIKIYKSLFDKIVMQNCSHNQSRPKEIIDKIFQCLNKFQIKINSNNSNNNGRLFDTENGGLYHTLIKNRSLDGKDRGTRGNRRGISVESKEKQKKRSVVSSNVTEQSEDHLCKDSNYTLLSYSSQKIEPKRQKVSCKVSQSPYVDGVSTVQFAKKTNSSPLKIRLSNNFNRVQSKISVSLPKRDEQKISSSSINSITNYCCAFDYDNSILQKKLLKEKIKQLGEDELSIMKNTEIKNNYKYRRNSQMNKKVQYQLNHTRYL